MDILVVKILSLKNVIGEVEVQVEFGRSEHENMMSSEQKLKKNHTQTQHRDLKTQKRRAPPPHRDSTTIQS
jgi:hypothetical protein